MTATPEKIAEWKALAEAATPGPWRWNMDDDGVATLYGGELVEPLPVADFWRKPLRLKPQDDRFESDLKKEQIANISLATAAREAVPALIADNEAKDRRIAELEAGLRLIAEGCRAEGHADRWVVIENPAFQPDNGNDPKIVIDTYSEAERAEADQP